MFIPMNALEPTPAARPTRVTRNEVLGKCEYFVDVRLWPLLNEMDPLRWLGNFHGEEMEYAIHLLQSFLYYSEEVTNALLKSAFQSLSKTVCGDSTSYLAMVGTWEKFVDTAIFTYVTGESPRPTDSGYAFARKARQVLAIEDERIVDPDTAMQRVLQRRAPVVFVDDFVGSGDQLIHTWHREVTLSPGYKQTFQAIAALGFAEFYYIPIVATQYGLNEIADSCTGIKVLPAHTFAPEYSALHPNSVMWPEHLRAGAHDFLRNVSERACIPDTDGNEDDWRGFHKLGLAVAFHHSVPDATLPLFTWNLNGWKPLIRGLR